AGVAGLRLQALLQRRDAAEEQLLLLQRERGAGLADRRLALDDRLRAARIADPAAHPGGTRWAIRIVTIDQAIAVVVDAVVADLGGGRGVATLVGVGVAALGAGGGVAAGGAGGVGATPHAAFARSAPTSHGLKETFADTESPEPGP